MHRPRTALLAVPPLTLAAALTAAPAANAAPSPAPAASAASPAPSAAAPSPSPAAATPRPVVHEAADTSAEQRAVTGYWTTARLAAAKPLDLPTKAALRFGAPATATAPGKPVVHGPTSASAAAGSAATAPARTSTGSAWSGGGMVVKTTGRVFFTITGGPSAGRNASCSGSAVTSANKSVVITAGHCVRTGGSFHSNWVFVPGYDQGKRPHGTWVATNLLTTPQWNSGEDLNYDVAAAVVAPLDGRRLVEAVGGQGIAFNQPRGRQMYSFGYPAGSPFDGSRLIYCNGQAFDDYLMSKDLGLNCTMTGGSSGGPWFLNFNAATGAGVLNSVNSFKYNFADFWMFGPYFGPEAQAVYQAAQRIGTT